MKWVIAGATNPSLGDSAPIKDVLEVLDIVQYSPCIKDRLSFFGGGPANVIRSMDATDVAAIVYPGWTNPPEPFPELK